MHHFKVMFLKSLLLLLVFLPYLTITNTKTLNAGAQKEEKPQQQPTKPKYGGVYRRGLGNDPASLDPAKITDIYEEVVVQQIFDGLVQYSENLMVIPCIASSWESSRDNLRWVFYLKKDAKFHNGRKVTARDFVYTYTRILNPETHSGAAPLISQIKGATEFREGKTKSVEGLRAVDENTLEIILSEPNSALIAILAMVNFGVVPEEEVESRGEAFGIQPVGTGPFKFVSWERNREIILKSYEDYHEGRPYLDQITFKIFSGTSSDEMFKMFEKGELDDSIIPVSLYNEIINDQRYKFYKRPSLSLRMLVMNNTYEYFKDKRVRQALNYAIDKEEISKVAGKGRLIPATGLIPKGMAGYKPEAINYPYSPQKAAQLLKEAGYPDGKGFPTIQFWSSVKSAGLLAEDDAIKSYLNAIGIKIEFNYLTDWPAFKKMIQEGKAPMFKYSWEADVPDPDNILGSLFYSKSSTNRAFYKNPDVDRLIEKARKEPDYHKRISLYSTIQDMIMEDAPVILLNYLAYERVFQKYVQGLEGTALGDHYFSLKRVWFDYENAPR
jgi:peptide/nickel transport system substrate-binding protein/oligopeptide transport system substrate-binding protein